MNSPLGDPRNDKNYSSNNNHNFAHNENNDTREFHVEINSPNVMLDKVTRKESFIHKISMNNNTSKLSPYKFKK